MLNTETVIKSLSNIQRWHGVRVIAAVSLDDETKGYPSKLPKNRIQYVYARPTNDYLSVKDHKTELSDADGNVFLKGYDIRSFLKRVRNGAMPETHDFLASEDVYVEHAAFRPVRTLATACFDRKATALKKIETIKARLRTDDTDMDAYAIMEVAHALLTAKACLMTHRMPPIAIHRLAKLTGYENMLPAIDKLSELIASHSTDELPLVSLNLLTWIKTEIETLDTQIAEMSGTGRLSSATVSDEQIDKLFRDIVSAIERDELPLMPKQEETRPRPRIFLACPNESTFSTRDVVKAASQNIPTAKENQEPTICAWPEMRLSPTERTNYLIRLTESMRDTDATLLVVTQDVIAIRAMEVACAKIACADRLTLMRVEDATDGIVTNDISSEELYVPYSDGLQRLEDMQYAIYDD